VSEKEQQRKSLDENNFFRWQSKIPDDRCKYNLLNGSGWETVVKTSDTLYFTTHGPVKQRLVSRGQVYLICFTLHSTNWPILRQS
jgi:hypothetical protein